MFSRRSVGASRSVRPGSSEPAGEDGSPGGPHLRVVSDDRYPGWEEVYRDNVGRLYGLMFAKVGNRADAEDLTAEVFMAALGPLRVSASVGEVRAYLLATARTVLAGYWRRRLGLQVTDLDEERVATVFADPVGEIGPVGEVEPGGGAGAVARAETILAALPARYERVLRLRFLEGRSVRETADELGVSVGNAKVLQHRALRQAAGTAQPAGAGQRSGPSRKET